MGLSVKRIDHIGIAVKNIDEALIFYKDILGLNYTGSETIDEQMVKTAFINVEGVNIELLEPTSEKSPIWKFLEKGRKGIHHIALSVDNIDEALNILQRGGVELIDKTPKLGAHNKKIAFIHPGATGGILLELCEEQNE